MRWIVIADSIWQVRPWTLPVLMAIYAIPLLRLLTFPVGGGGRFFTRLNRRFGQWEHLVSPARNWFVDWYLILGATWLAWRGMETATPHFFVAAGVALALAFTGFAMRAWRRKAHLCLLSFVQAFPAIHPQEFFDHLLSCAGAIRPCFPAHPFSTIDPARLDFRTGSPSRRGVGVRTLLAGAWSTMWLARLILLMHRRGDRCTLRAVASSLAVVWGSRIAQLARAAVTVEGREHLISESGPQMYLFTHMSFLDFAFVPLALAARPGAEGQVNYLPAFLLAKDHFRDNFLYYRLLGIGRTAEVLGMIFVERRRGEPAERARLVAHIAASQLVAGEAVLAIFPQGTRAAAYVGARGERLDSGYYTVGSRERIRADGKHLKKGAAHIALDAAREIESRKQRQSVRLIPIAFSGTGIACPKGSMRIMPNIHIRLRVGDPILVDPTPEDDGVALDRLHARIDNALKGIGRVHAELERRFFEDMRGLVDPLKIEEVAIALKPWRGEDYLLHAILDAIYACPAKAWRPAIGELVHLLLNFASRDDLLAFKGRIANTIPM